MQMEFDGADVRTLDSVEVFTDRLPGSLELRRRIARYLWTPPTWPLLLALAFAIPTILVGLGIGLLEAWVSPAVLGREADVLPIVVNRVWPGLVGCGLAVVAWYVPRGYRRRRGLADQQFDVQLQEDVKAVIERGRRAMGLRYPAASLVQMDDDQTIVREPLVLTRGVWPSDLATHPALSHADVELACVVLGDDGGRRFGIYEIDVVYMAQHHLSLYVAYVDTRSGSLLAEDAHEAHYKDINSLHARERQHRDVPWPALWLKVRRFAGDGGWPGLLGRLVDAMLRRLLRRQVFVTRAFDVRLGSGTCLSVPFHSTRARDARTPGASLTAENVRTLRELLREKRKGYVRLITDGVPPLDNTAAGLTLVEPRM